MNKFRRLKLLLAHMTILLWFVATSVVLNAKPSQSEEPSQLNKEKENENFLTDSQRFHFETPKDPKLHLIGRPTAITQDHVGYIWFSGHGGLARYDAYQFHLYSYDPNDKHSLSNNNVNAMLVDSGGTLWLATSEGLNQYDADNDNFIRLTVSLEIDGHGDANTLNRINKINKLIGFDSENILLGSDHGIYLFNKNSRTFGEFKSGGKQIFPSHPISALFKDKRGDLWIGTEADGLFQHNTSTGETFHHKHNPNIDTTISHSSIRTVKADQRGDIWVGTNSGLNLFNRKNKSFTRFYYEPFDPASVPYYQIDDFWEDAFGNFWVLNNGLNLFNRKTGEFKNFRQDSYLNGRYGLHNSKAWRVFEDSSHNIWLSHFPSGISMMDRYASSFQVYQHRTNEPDSLSNQDILSVEEDNAHNLWVGTERGLNYVDFNSSDVTQYLMDLEDPISLPGNPVLDILVDSKNRVWVGTWGGGLSLLKEDKNGFLNYRTDETLGLNINDKEVWKIFEDKKGNIWIGSEKGLGQYNPQKQTFERIKNGNKAIISTQITTIHEDAYGEYWLGGFEGFCKMDPKTLEFKHFIANKKDKDSIHGLSINNVVELEPGEVWVATGSAAHKYNRETDTFSFYNKKTGLSNNSVSNIIKDDEGYLWFSTHNGISRLNPETNEIRHLTTKTGLPGNNYRRPASLKMKNGKLVFGSDKGVAIFNPKDLFINKHLPPVVITDFSLFNKSVKIGDKNNILDKHISNKQHLTLNYEHSVFSFEYLALNYISSSENQYAYMLEGFDKDWNHVGKQRKATYTNLDPGSYIFRVKASNNEGFWNHEGAAINITILPPWWRTWWAYTIYIMTFLGTLAEVIYLQVRRRRHAELQARILEVKVAQRTSELRVKNDDIQCMLSNMQQGLFTIEDEGKIHHEYSAYLESIFETKNIAGELAAHLLFSNSKIDEDKKSQLESAIHVIVGSDHANFDFNQHLLVKEYELEFYDSKAENQKDEARVKHIELAWNPIIENSCIVKLMVTVRDRTELRRLKEEATNKERELDIVAQLIRGPSSKFITFVKSCEEFIRETRNIIESNLPHMPKAKERNKMFRNIHTLKGNSRTRGLSYISEACHKAENYYSELSASSWDFKRAQQDLNEVESVVYEYRDICVDLLGRGENHVELKSGDIVINQDLITQYRQNCETKESETIDDFLAVMRALPLDELLDDQLKSLPEIALQLQKETPNVLIKSSNVRISHTLSQLIQNIFTHLLRNSIDHGLESSSERLAANKKPAGEIIISASIESDNLFIKIKDDGRGLNIKRLIDKGIDLDYWQKNDKLTLNEIAELIFVSGVSTKKDVSDISGRGVGMDAIKQFLHQHQGDICINFTHQSDPDAFADFEPFEFIIKLPSRYGIILPGQT